MQNKHLEHPEDSILTGDLSVLKWFSEPKSKISTKIDGSVAIVWGKDPANKQFFVGTKAVFNKKKIRIAHSHEEIDQFYDGEVAIILHNCFDFLPRISGIIQGDFIGFGGTNEYKSNTITYKFLDVVKENIIIAPHTFYSKGNDLREVKATPLMKTLKGTENCKFIQPKSSLDPYREDLADFCKFAQQMSTLCEFVSNRKAMEIKKEINACIREGIPIIDSIIAEECECDINLIRLWKLVESIKMDLFPFIEDVDNSIRCEINGEESYHEGYVIHNQYGTYKVVDRYEFSTANFNSGRF